MVSIDFDEDVFSSAGTDFLGFNCEVLAVAVDFKFCRVSAFKIPVVFEVSGSHVVYSDFRSFKMEDAFALIYKYCVGSVLDSVVDCHIDLSGYVVRSGDYDCHITSVDDCLTFPYFNIDE